MADDKCPKHLPFLPDIRPLSDRYTTVSGGVVEESFFQNASDFRVRDRSEKIHLDGFVCQQAQCPASVSGGRVRASQSSNLSFRFRLDSRRFARTRFVRQSRLEAFFEKTLLQVINRHNPHAEKPGDGFRMFLAGKQIKNSGASLLTRRSFFFSENQCQRTFVRF